MTKTTLTLALMASAIVFAPTLVKAEEPATQSSYSLKKQGRVPFTPSETPAATDAQTPAVQEPAAIEPAAGAEDESSEQDSQKNSLEDQIKLPRKN